MKQPSKYSFQWKRSPTNARTATHVSPISGTLHQSSAEGATHVSLIGRLACTTRPQRSARCDIVMETQRFTRPREKSINHIFNVALEYHTFVFPCGGMLKLNSLSIHPTYTSVEPSGHILFHRKFLLCFIVPPAPQRYHGTIDWVVSKSPGALSQSPLGPWETARGLWFPRYSSPSTSPLQPPRQAWRIRPFLC